VARQRLREDFGLILHFTRNWIHYGALALVALLSLVAAVRGVAAE
jgi:hypothetical protein